MLVYLTKDYSKGEKEKAISIKRNLNLRFKFLLQLIYFLTNGLIATYRAESLPRESAKNLVLLIFIGCSSLTFASSLLRR